MNKKLNADFDFKNRGFFILKKWLEFLWKKVVINWKEWKRKDRQWKRDIERKGDKKNNGKKTNIEWKIRVYEN